MLLTDFLISCVRWLSRVVSLNYDIISHDILIFITFSFFDNFCLYLWLNLSFIYLNLAVFKVVNFLFLFYFYFYSFLNLFTLKFLYFDFLYRCCFLNFFKSYYSLSHQLLFQIFLLFYCRVCYISNCDIRLT